MPSSFRVSCSNMNFMLPAVTKDDMCCSLNLSTIFKYLTGRKQINRRKIHKQAHIEFVSHILFSTVSRAECTMN